MQTSLAMKLNREGWSRDDILQFAFENLEKVGQALKALDIPEDDDVWLAFHNLDGTLGDIEP